MTASIRFARLIVNASVLGIVGTATLGASFLVPRTAGGGIDVVGVAATTEAILLTGVGLALALTSAIRVPRFGEGSLTPDGIASRSLSILATALAVSALVLAARPALPSHAIVLVPLLAYGLVSLSLIVGLAKRVSDGSDPRAPRDPARTG